MHNNVAGNGTAAAAGAGGDGAGGCAGGTGGTGAKQACRCMYCELFGRAGVRMRSSSKEISFICVL